jgi:hypothetical protein
MIVMIPRGEGYQKAEVTRRWRFLECDVKPKGGGYTR